MKRFVSAWNMHKAKKAFTLIEVMVSVLIISVVIMALFEMQGNNSHFFSKFYKKIEINQILSFFISNKNYGFEKDDIYLDDLLSEFKLEDELRRKLKIVKVELDYKELALIDMSEEESEDGEETEESQSMLVLEIGKTIIRLKDGTSSSIIRLKLQ